MFRVWRASLLQQQNMWAHKGDQKITIIVLKWDCIHLEKKIKYHCSCHTTSGITILIPIPSPPEHEN